MSSLRVVLGIGVPIAGVILVLDSMPRVSMALTKVTWLTLVEPSFEPVLPMVLQPHLFDFKTKKHVASHFGSQCL